MKIKLLVVGKTSNTFIKSLISDYEDRINYFINYEMIEINLKKNKNISEKEIKKKEGIKILDRIEKKDYVVLFDENGKEYSSVEFSEFIKNKITNFSKKIIFVVGGAYGFSDDIYVRSNSLISLSKMTFSHQMIRIFILEQLYRAFTIINNHPYHNN
jgi:23S rRNA (pseudouridine1915-N3)-methyltransferase